MKALLLATALIASPLIAQDQPPAPPPPTETAPPADPAAMAPAPDAANAANAAEAAEQPAPPPPPPPGTTVVFQQPKTVDQAFPPPPAKESYPWCSKTVTDGCKQRYNPK